MKKLLLLLALVPFLLSAQEITPANLTDLSKYHDGNRLLEKTDDNFAILNAELDNAADSSWVTIEVDSADITVLDADSIVTRVFDYAPPHGCMAFADSAAVIPLSTNIWGKVTNEDNDLFTIIDDDDLSFDGDSITVEVHGDYVIWWALSFNGGASDVYHAAVYVNNVITPFEMHRKTGNNDTGSMSLNGYLEHLEIGDDISFWIRNTGDNDDPTLVSSQITLFMLHPQ